MSLRQNAVFFVLLMCINSVLPIIDIVQNAIRGSGLVYTPFETVTRNLFSPYMISFFVSLSIVNLLYLFFSHLIAGKSVKSKSQIGVHIALVILLLLFVCIPVLQFIGLLGALFLYVLALVVMFLIRILGRGPDPMSPQNT